MKISIALVIVGIVLLYTLYEVVRVSKLTEISKNLIVSTHPYERSEGVRSLLVLGDSTGVGVGTLHPTDSVAARLSNFLDASVENYSVSGARVADLKEQFSQAKKQTYDVVLIQVGANDVTHLTPIADVDTGINAILEAARTRSDHVILMTAGRVGDAPAFPFVVGQLFNWRSSQIREHFIADAARSEAMYVDLIGVSDVFKSDSVRYYAPDSFHPSSDGYALWFDVLKEMFMKKWPQLVHGA